MGKGSRRRRFKTRYCDILVQNFPAEAVSPRDISSDFVAPTLGKRTALIAKIVDAVPEFDFSDPAWGVLNRSECQMEIHLGHSVHVSSFNFHVHGGRLSHALVRAILTRLKLRGLDLETGKFMSQLQPNRMSAAGMSRIG